MILPDALVEEIFQLILRLPYATVEQLVAKLRIEASAPAQEAHVARLRANGADGALVEGNGR